MVWTIPKQRGCIAGARPDEEEPGPQVEFLPVGPAEEEDEEEPLAEMSRIEQQAMAARR